MPMASELLRSSQLARKRDCLLSRVSSAPSWLCVPSWSRSERRESSSASRLRAVGRRVPPPPQAACQWLPSPPPLPPLAASPLFAAVRAARRLHAARRFLVAAMRECTWPPSKSPSAPSAQHAARRALRSEPPAFCAAAQPLLGLGRSATKAPHVWMARLPWARLPWAAAAAHLTTRRCHRGCFGCGGTRGRP